jgi:hypothetical protein
MVYDLPLRLQPVQVYVELAKFIDEATRTFTARLTFRIITDLEIDALEADSSTGLRVHVNDLLAKVRFSVSQITISQQAISYMYKPIGLDILLNEKEFRANDLFIIGSDWYPNIWIRDHLTRKTHKANEPLIKGKKYDLMINIDRNSYPKTPNDQEVSGFVSDGRVSHEVFVSVFGEAFEIGNFDTEHSIHEVEPYDALTQKMRISKRGISEEVAFIIEPKNEPQYSNIQKLKIYFHFKQNLLQVLSVSLKIVSAVVTTGITDLAIPLITRFKQDEISIPVDIVTSGSLTFDAIRDLED